MNHPYSKPAKYPVAVHKLKRTILFAAAATLVLAASVQAGTVVWNGLSGTDTNWSNGANWIGAVAPGGGDDVKFFDAGAVGATGAAGTNTPNNLMDGSFGGYIGSLQYGNTNGNHTTVIASGATLNITNTGGLTVGTLTAPNGTQKVFAAITGAGSTLMVSNPAANINIVQGTNSANSGTGMRATLDLSGLDNFVARVARVSVGSATLGNANNAQNATGTLLLGRTNIVTATYPGTGIAVNNAATPTNSIDVGSDNGNAGGVDFLYLGQTNAFYIDSIGVGELKTTASLLFNPLYASPTAYFRGTNGNSSRIRFWTVGDMSSSGSSSAAANGTNDFSAGSVDILADTMSLARDRQGGNTGATATRGTIYFAAGIIDVNTLLVGNQAFTATANVNPMVGVFNVNGAGATLKVNTTLTLGKTTAVSTAATTTTGTLNITNGTVLANLIAVGATSTNNVINLNNALLVVTNTISTNANGLANFRIGNSTLGLTVATNSSLLGLSQVLTTFGSTNYIQLASGPVIFASYPKQFPLLKYTTWSGANNFGLINLPAWASGATLVSNGPNASLDLLLPSDPRPVITSGPSGYSGSPGDLVNFSVSISAGSVTPLGYQWYKDSTPLTDGVTGNGSSLSGSTGSSLAISAAQSGDNGNYTVVITNVYGSVTSSPAAVLTISAGSVAPIISGPLPTSQTAIAGSNITFSASVSGNPAPSVYWQFNGNGLTDGPTGDGDSISGSTGNALTVSNVQYPGSQGTYSIIASNSAGLATNYVVLTVLVPPVITNQPVSLVVTNTQSATFAVTAGGVPSVSYQWYKNSIGNPIASATNASFNIPSAAPSDTATYFVVVQNTGGSATSSNVTLTVNSTLSALSLSPANAATGICYDTPLYITFSQAPSLRNTGKIRIYNVNNSATPVDTIDLSLNSAGGVQSHSPFAGDGQAFNYYPVIITGATAAIYPHGGVMTSNQTYYVIVDDGTFTDASGAYFAGITATNGWQFATKAGGSANPASLVVAADGSGDFATVQGAVDSIPLNNSTYTLINIRNGNYVELVNISSKNKVTFRGQSRTGTMVGYANNVNIGAGGGTTHARMAFKVNAKDIAVENMTITNSTPQGGGQAEALMIESGASRFILNNAEVVSRQDTILANVNTSQGYFYHSLIKGNFDYIWGGGNLFFTNCEIQTITGVSSPNLAAPRTDNGVNGNWPGYLGLNVSNGFSFVNCQLTRQTNTVVNCSMSGSNGSTNGNAVWINCSIDTGCYINASATAQNSQLLWEYGCSNLNNSVLLDNTGVPFGNFTQLTVADPKLLAAGSATNWLNGWQPQLAPNIITQPADSTVIASQTATFTVAATGIPDASYQWLQNGTNAPYASANSATLVIPNTQAIDAGTLSVVVSNAAGTVTSSSAVLTVITPVAPTLGSISYSGGSGLQFSISGTAGLNYRVWATTNLLLSPVTATWTLVGSDVFGASPVVFTDAQATNFPQRFYTVTIP